MRGTHWLPARRGNTITTAGSVYVESFAAGLGLPAPVHSRSGGQNFAHGGAKTTGTSFPNSVVVRDIDDQVSDFLSTASADPDALFVVFASANDILDTQIANLANPVNRLRDSIDALVSAGARQFLVFNQPLMGETPRFNSNPANRTAYNARSTQFNTALTSTLDTLDDNLALTIFRFDVAALFNQALASPQSFGLTNTTASAAPGLTPGASSYNTNQIAPNADEYLFWDDLHPTATVHAALAKRALAVVSRGDFNWDGVVDAADYVIWRKEYSFVDFNEWRGNFGESAGMGAAASVPEPGLLASIAASVIIGVAASGRRRGKS
jgi:phospholipase/lecithinase/hemolysin